MSITILAIGLMVFFAHFLSLQFRNTNVSGTLVLIPVGILLDPILSATRQDLRTRTWQAAD